MKKRNTLSFLFMLLSTFAVSAQEVKLGVEPNHSTINRLDFGIGADFQHSTIENFLAEEVELQINFWTRRAREG